MRLLYYFIYSLGKYYHCSLTGKYNSLSFLNGLHFFVLLYVCMWLHYVQNPDVFGKNKAVTKFCSIFRNCQFESTLFHFSILFWQTPTLQRLLLKNTLVNMFLIHSGSYRLTVVSLVLFFFPPSSVVHHEHALSELHLVITSISQYKLSDERKRRFTYRSKAAIVVFFFSSSLWNLN